MNNNETKIDINDKSNTINYGLLLEKHSEQFSKSNLINDQCGEKIRSLSNYINLNQDIGTNYLNFLKKASNVDVTNAKFGYSFYFSLYSQLVQITKDFPKQIIKMPKTISSLSSKEKNVKASNKKFDQQEESYAPQEKQNTSVEQLSQEKIEALMENDPYYLLILQHLPKFIIDSNSMTILEMFIPNKVTNILKKLKNKELKINNYSLTVYEHTYFKINLIFRKPQFIMKKEFLNLLP